jgi:CubicO group peptidase (beta-lactamase class C family)
MQSSLVHQLRLGWPTNYQSTAAFFWINGLGQYPVPRDSYYMAGAGGQTTMIVPSHDLVVVRLGHYKGEAIGTVAFRKALKLLLEAVPRHD